MASNRKHTKKSIDQAVKDKMRCLWDFDICDIHDKEMKEKLMSVVAAQPDRDPREVLDYYCRPMIQDKINSWV